METVHLKAKKGEVIGVFGRNGSGKTTLFQCISGQIKSDIRLLVDGLNIAPNRLLRQKLLGYVPQFSFLPSHIRVRELIPLYIQDDTTADQIFYDPLLVKVLKNRPSELSIGERKYLELLLVGHLQRPILILDEPFTMMEPKQIEASKQLIQLWSSDALVLISDHYYQQVRQITTRNMILENGVGHWISEETDWRKFRYTSSE